MIPTPMLCGCSMTFTCGRHVGTPQPERGEAGITVTLEASKITVRHVENGTLLASGVVKAGAWSALWDKFEELGVGPPRDVRDIEEDS